MASIIIELSGMRSAAALAMRQLLEPKSQFTTRFKLWLCELSLRHKRLNRKVVGIVAVILSTLAFGAARLASDGTKDELDLSALLAMRSPGERNAQALFQTKPDRNDLRAIIPFRPKQRVLSNYRFRRPTVILGDINTQPFVRFPLLPPIALLPANPNLSFIFNPSYSMPLGTPGERVSAIPVTPIPEPSIWLTMTIGMAMAVFASSRVKTNSYPRVS